MRSLVAAGLFLATACLRIGPAWPQAIYFGGEGGWSPLTGETDRSAGLPAAAANYDAGFAAGVRAGYEMEEWRFEAEYAYRRNALGSLRSGGASLATTGGSRQSQALMADVIRAFDLGLPVTPHLGVGIGAVEIVDEATVAGIGKILDDDDWRFGYQTIAGLRYSLSASIAFDLDYHYLATTGADFRVRAAPAVTYRSGYEAHTLMASLVYRFGPPPPPPPIVAPPPPPPVVRPRVFLVFFDWSKSVLTPEGRQVVARAAAAYKAGAPVRLEVTGFADRSGSVEYNRRLSERRAENVALTLIRLGVPRNDLAVSGHGEADNRLATADGVREPQNRRAEIAFP
jgi:outer membrane protein OmpA-like peptidoglycan-associated protein